MRPKLALSLAAVVAALAPLAAHAAASGTITGKMQFYQNQGNYCPTSRSCTGAKYLESAYHTNQPLAHGKLRIQRKSDGAVLGQGTTAADGSFTISWADPAATSNVDAQIVFRGEHKDGRFQIKTTENGYWVWWSNVTLVKGGTTAAGSRTWGNAASPHALSNLYDGAYKMWANSLSQSNRMNSFFTDVDIVAFDSVCPTSCANGPANRITIDSSTSAYRPQGRILHEMGHIASYRASRDQEYKQSGPSSYCFNETAPCGWSLDSAEYATVHFEEAVATHLGDVALYTPSATAPHTCLSSVACSTGSFNIESSGGTSCAADHDRRPINAVRYFWDNYDSVSDYTGESLAMGMWHVVDTIHAFDNGTADGDKNEVWNGDLSAMNDLDGRSCIDFRDHWKDWGTDSSTELSQNCGSEGD
jgi:hypothetical protein